MREVEVVSGVPASGVPASSRGLRSCSLPFCGHGDVMSMRSSCERGVGHSRDVGACIGPASDMSGMRYLGSWEPFRRPPAASMSRPEPRARGPWAQAVSAVGAERFRDWAAPGLGLCDPGADRRRH